LTAWPEHDAVVPRRDSRRHPLCALYRREPVLAVASERLKAGDLRLSGLLDSLDCDHLEGDALDAVDPDRSALSNVNTPAERTALERLWAERASGGLFGIGTLG